MVSPRFRVGMRAKRAVLRPFEVDTLVPKVHEAVGKVVRVWTEDIGRFVDGYLWKYEVIWTWPNKETCLAHYEGYQLEFKS